MASPEDSGDGKAQLRMDQARENNRSALILLFVLCFREYGQWDILNTQTRPSTLTKRNKVAIEIRAVFGFRILQPAFWDKGARVRVDVFVMVDIDNSHRDRRTSGDYELLILGWLIRGDAGIP